MIKGWFLGHRLVVELVKGVIAILFGLFGYAVWLGGRRASLGTAASDSYKLVVFGVDTSILEMLALVMVVVMVVDVVCSLICWWRDRC